MDALLFLLSETYSSYVIFNTEYKSSVSESLRQFKKHIITFEEKSFVSW